MNRYFGLHVLEGEWHSLLPRYSLLAERVEGKRVLDIGCGTGIGSSLILELGAERVEGVDHRPEVIELASMKHDKQGLDFHVMFWEELDFPENSFDLVLCLDPSSPITDPNLLMEVRRILKDGGEYVCALERTKIEGIETILPKYGYAESAESVTIGQGEERVPQIGQLSDHFDTVVSVVQRPQCSYVFDLSPEPGVERHEDIEQSMMRRTSDGEGGLWASESSVVEDEQLPDDVAKHSGRWLASDRRLCTSESIVAGVELLFCGDDHMPPPPTKEIQLPYFSIVERLRMMIHDLQSKQDPASSGAQFDEVVDSPEDARQTDSWPNQGRDGSLEDAPTQVRKRPDQVARRGGGDRLRISELERQVDQLTQLYYQLRDDLDLQLDRQQRELQERDRYIDHLVDTVYEWEQRFDDAADGEVGDDGGFGDLDELSATDEERPTNDFNRSETATTSIYRVDDLKRRERAQVDEDAPEDELRDELEDLRRERERLERELEERDRRLAELHTENNESQADSLSEESDGEEPEESEGLGEESSSDVEDEEPTGLGEESSSDVEDDEPTGLGEESSSDAEDDE
ncbi:MAG: class I SAM-dependent methyltransferase [Myxococcota bacterium]